MRKKNKPYKICHILKQFHIVAAMLLCLVATCSFFACSDDDSQVIPNTKYVSDRTIMVYMVAENSLGIVKNASGSAEKYSESSVLTSDIREMINGMSNDTFPSTDRLIIYVDGVSLPRIYVLDKSVKGKNMADLEPVYPYDEDVNSASVERLTQFVKYTKENYPAKSYGLVMWSHGSGWIPSTYAGDLVAATEAANRSFGLDNGKDTNKDVGNQMDVAEMARGLEEAGGVDFIFFDACFMQCVESAYALRHATKEIVASPAEIPAPGANYTTMVPAMFRKDDCTEHMLSAYYKAYQTHANYGVIISAIKTDAIRDFASYMKSLVRAKKEELLSLNKGAVLNYFLYGQWGVDAWTGQQTVKSPDFLDMQGVMKQVLDENEFEEWKEEAMKVVTCQHTARWYSAHKKGQIVVNDSQCCGMSMFIPFDVYTNDGYQYNADYMKTEWAQDVWND